jgi:hypothetical protein
MSQETLTAINDLQPIAKRLREREEQIESGKKHLYEHISELTGLAYEQGRDLITAKTKTGKTVRFSEWLHIHVPNLPIEQATKYERVATEQLHDPRQCIFAFIPAADAGNRLPVRAKPSAWELGWGYAHRLLTLTSLKPIDGWPDKQRECLATELQPIAKALWPEKFSV